MGEVRNVLSTTGYGLIIPLGPLPIPLSFFSYFSQFSLLSLLCLAYKHTKTNLLILPYSFLFIGEIRSPPPLEKAPSLPYL